MASAADLPVDLVEEIFLRLDDAADLVRASAACAAFRRVVSDGRFHHRFRSLHRRPVLGLLSRGFRFHPAEPPRRSAQAGRAVAGAAGFSSSFLPDQAEHCWHVHDARDGRVLLSPGDATTCLLSFSYLVVYDPLHRKHVQIPPIPKDIVACTCSLQQGCSCGSDCNCECGCEFDPFLVPADDDEDDLSFRVMCTVLSTGLEYDFLLETFVYSSVTGRWRGVASLSDTDYEPLYDLSSMDRHYVHGCFYWVASYSEKDMLVLDMNEMKFSVVRLPPGTKHKAKVVVKAAAEDRIGLLVLCRSKKKLHLYTMAFGDPANDCWQWRHDAETTLLDSYLWLFCGAADQGYALLQGVPRDEYLAWSSSPEEMRPKTNAHYFTVELQTLLVEQLCVTEFDTELALVYASFPPAAFLYASFPPPFALPSI
jgi:hypothetical protein